MKFHDSLQFPRLNAKQNNGPILHFALRKLEKLNQGNFLLAGIWYRPKITQYTVALKLYPGCLQTLSFTLPLSPLSSLSPPLPPLLTLPLSLMTFSKGGEKGRNFEWLFRAYFSVFHRNATQNGIKQVLLRDMTRIISNLLWAISSSSLLWSIYRNIFTIHS